MDLPDLGTELGSPALRADSLPTELSGKSLCFMGLDKQPIHHYSFRHSSFAALKLLCALPALFPCPEPLVTTTTLTLPPWSCLIQNAIWLESCSMWSFQIGFFHTVICVSVSSMNFHGLIAYFF